MATLMIREALATCDDLEKSARENDNVTVIMKVHELRYRLLGFPVDRHEATRNPTADVVQVS